MAIDGISRIAGYVGGVFTEQDTIDNNLSPENGEFINVIETEDGIVIGGIVKGYKWIFATDAFIIDHPIQGELDSAVYKLDGGIETQQKYIFL